MKKYILFLMASTALLSCDMRRKDKISDDAAKQRELALKDSTSVQAIDSVYNFGRITEGEKVTYSYHFKNTGNKPLIIERAVSTCGCTVPERPEKPIMPGETAFIKVVFNSENKAGQVDKKITVTSNAKPAFTVLTLMGEVMKKE